MTTRATAFEFPEGSAEENVLSDGLEGSQAMVETAVGPKPAPVAVDNRDERQRMIEAAAYELRPGIDEVAKKLRKQLLTAATLELVALLPSADAIPTQEQIEDATHRAIRKIFGLDKNQPLESRSGSQG